MFKLYSKGTEYALRAMASLDAGQKVFTARDVCRKARIPEPFTRKMLQSLARDKVLKAVQGPGGGYQLNKPASKIPLIDVIRSIDGKEHYDQCVMGLPQCRDDKACSLHDLWVSAKKNLILEFKKRTVQDLISGHIN